MGGTNQPTVDTKKVFQIWRILKKSLIQRREASCARKCEDSGLSVQDAEIQYWHTILVPCRYHLFILPVFSPVLDPFLTKSPWSYFMSTGVGMWSKEDLWDDKQSRTSRGMNRQSHWLNSVASYRTLIWWTRGTNILFCPGKHVVHMGNALGIGWRFCACFWSFMCVPTRIKVSGEKKLTREELLSCSTSEASLVAQL